MGLLLTGSPRLALWIMDKIKNPSTPALSSGQTNTSMRCAVQCSMQEHYSVLPWSGSSLVGTAWSWQGLPGAPLLQVRLERAGGTRARTAATAAATSMGRWRRAARGLPCWWGTGTVTQWRWKMEAWTQCFRYSESLEYSTDLAVGRLAEDAVPHLLVGLQELG